MPISRDDHYVVEIVEDFLINLLVKSEVAVKALTH